MHENLMDIRVTETSGYNMTDLDGQVITDISNLNGTLQFDYGVNGAAGSEVPAASGENQTNVTLTDTPAQSSTGALLSRSIGKIRHKLGAGAANPLTNTPNLYTVASRHFSFFKLCTGISLEHMSGERQYKLTARCPRALGGMVEPNLFIQLTGQNGRYRIADANGKQIDDITLEDGVTLQPVYTKIPNVLTIVAQKYSCMNPQNCLRTSFDLVPRSADNKYVLFATCTNERKINQTSEVDLIITGSDGAFTITDPLGQFVSDVFNNNGRLKVAPLVQALTLNPMHDFNLTCQNARLIVKDPATLGKNVYTLEASCSAALQGFKPTSLDIVLSQSDGVIMVKAADGSACQSISNVNGALTCKAG